MRIALVHDWVVMPGGAEKCLQALHELYPEAPLYTLFYNTAEILKLGFAPEQVHGSYLHCFKFIHRHYRNFLPFFPRAIEHFDLSRYDMILSSSHCAAKGVKTRPGQLHICYCHSPARYAWDMTEQYLADHGLNGVKGAVSRSLLNRFRRWDAGTANKVDHFIANSCYTADRIRRAYDRDASVIYPPVDIDKFQAAPDKEDYFVFVSRLVPYKQAALAIEAFNRLGLPLKVVGDGPSRDDCRRQAGRNVEMLGYVTGAELAAIMGRARALVFPADEDFGIVPVEAQACATPVIALGRGGVTETVVPADGSNWSQATGVFFHEQTIASLCSAIISFLDWEGRFQSDVIRRHAERFNRRRFMDEISAAINRFL